MPSPKNPPSRSSTPRHCALLRTPTESRSIDLHDCFLAALATERETRVLSVDDDFRRLGVRETP